MNNKTLSYIGIALAVVALLVSFLTMGSGSKQSAVSDTTFNKILSSGTLKAGYIVYAPYIAKDPKTGELSGIFYDLVNDMGKRLGTKVEWVEEAGYGTISTSLSAGRYDLYAGIWPSADRSKAITFTVPVYYDAVYAYARNNDQRFNNNLEAINSSQIKISTIDGELADTIARETFSGAERISLPQTAPFDQLALQVISNKADVTFLPPSSAGTFLKANPGTLKRVSDTPVRIYGTTLGVKLGETNLKNMLDVVVQELIATGRVKEILGKYDPTALQVAPPYTK